MRAKAAIATLGSVLFFGVSTASSQAESQLSSPVVLPDGTVATPYDRCGATDLCADIKYPSGDELTIYSEGAAKFHPYHLHFTVLKHGTTPIVEYDDTTETPAERASGRERDLVVTYVMDRGKLRLDFYTNKDGTLKPRFTVGAATPEAVDATPTSPIPSAT